MGQEGVEGVREAKLSTKKNMVRENNHDHAVSKLTFTNAFLIDVSY